MDSRFSDVWRFVCAELQTNCAQSTFSLWYSDLILVDLTEKYAFFTYPLTAKRDIFFSIHAKNLAPVLADILGYTPKIVIISLEELTPESKDEQIQFTIDLCKSGKLDADKINTSKDGYLINEFSKNNLLEPDKIVEPGYYDSLNSSEQIFNSANPPKQYHKEYTFENFVVGNSNKFAHAASMSVATNPANSYNPLFIHGPSGLGKTHLLYAITNKILSNNENASIIYVKGEEFTNQLIEALSKNTPHKFREKYRHCDVLLVDDVQFISGKPSIQEEFFHTFNALYENRKQIILTSDRPPKDIPLLEDRLKTRFEWGLIADIQPPDFELRIAILKRKAEDLDIQVSNDVLVFLAENIKSNIRQIEGAIKRLDAYSKLNGKSISVELAKNAVGDFLNISDMTITKDGIVSAVCDYYKVTKDEIIGKKRTTEIVNARFIAIYLLRTLTDMSSPEIGKEFQRDHTTVLNAETKISDKLKADPQLEYEINTLIKKIKNP